MPFFDGPLVEKQIRRLLLNADSAKIAVAYWGDGALERLGLDKIDSSRVQIVCNARSGGCNITEVRGLIAQHGKERVLTSDRLHAKVWLTDDAAIVGSSNASTNGFGIEGEDASGLIEGNVLVTAPKTLATIRRWFEGEVMRSAREITKSDFKRGDKERNKRGAFDRSTKRTVLEELARNPSAFDDRNINVWIWPMGYQSKAAQKHVITEGQRRNLPDLDFWEDVSDDDLLPPGSIVIEFDSSTELPTYEGIFRVLDDKPVIPFRRSKLLLCQKKRNVVGSPIGEKSVWRKAALLAAESSGDRYWDGTLTDFVATYLEGN